MSEASHAIETIYSRQIPRILKAASYAGKTLVVSGALLVTGTEPVATSEAINVQPFTIADPALSRASAAEVPIPDPSDGHPDLGNSHCTSIRTGPKYIYIGLACKEDGATYQKVDVGPAGESQGWTYSTLLVRGIYKCGFVREGVIPQKVEDPQAVNRCQNFFSPMVNNRYAFLTDYNCGQNPDGTDKCESGTFFSHISKTCIQLNLNTLYGNFATNAPSIFNALGTGNGGFSMPLPNKIETGVSYRAQSKLGSDDGKAIVVRDINDTAYLDWGLYQDMCVNESERNGGKIKAAN